MNGPRALTLGLALLALPALAGAALHAAPQEAVPPAEPAAAVLPADPVDEYTLGPGDVIEIDVFGLDDLDRRLRIARDGIIRLPLLGTFNIAGKSLQQAEELIAAMLREQRLVNEPHVSIFVQEFVSRTVSVQGAVESPGVYPILGYGRLLDMIGVAGGVTGDEGDTILVLRGTGDSQGKIEIDSRRLLREGDLKLNIQLMPGDVVLVPEIQELKVYVSGAVENPGAVEFNSSEGLTVQQAIAAAGGATSRANLSKVEVYRQLADGEQLKMTVNLKKIRRGKAEEVLLEGNDTVVVKEWFF